MTESAARHAVAVGVFDGVHRGHQRILETALARAAERSVDLAVVTFEPHPDAVLGKAPPKPPLTPVGEKAELLLGLGAKRVNVLHFDRRMAELGPEEFVHRHLLDELGLVYLVAGADFALGRGRRGTIPFLTELGRRLGFGVEGVPLLSDAGGPVTSTRIRSLLGEGRVAEAAELFGRLYRIEAQVVTGRGLGRELGFPTANLELLEHQLLPADGIYAVWVLLGDGARRPGALSIGTRPSVGGGPRTVEVHVLGYDGDLRGRSLALEFAAWLREERRFPTLEALSLAIAEDVAVVRERLGPARDAMGGESAGRHESDRGHGTTRSPNGA